LFFGFFIPKTKLPDIVLITVEASVGFLTGRYLATTKRESSWGNILDKKFTTLAEYLKGFGYRTIAFLGNPRYEAGTGFEQGFDRFVFAEASDELTQKASEFLKERSGRQPVFLWIHYMDTHIPYRYRESDFKIFEGDALYGRDDKILKCKPQGLQDHDVWRDWDSSGYIPPRAFHKDKFSLNYYIACYDADILYADALVGALLKRLKKNTLVVLTADHGTSLGEHNVYFHFGENIYDETLRIPLIIKEGRSFKGGRKVQDVVSGVDIVPSVLARVNPSWYAVHKNEFDGLDLKDAARGAKIPRSYIYSYDPWAWSIRDVATHYKYIYFADRREQLFALPDENLDLTAVVTPEVRAVKERLRGALGSWLKRYPVPSDENSKKISLGQETQDRLRSLGYLQ
jgi:arylsulfatase A-like enzyme